jgi:hypothetical protein
MKQKLFALALLGTSLLPLAAFAQVPGFDVPEPVDIRTIEELLRVIEYIADVIFTVLMIVAVILILIAAFHYLTAAGDPTKVKKAHDMLIYAAVAIAVGLIAKGITFIVRTILQR